MLKKGVFIFLVILFFIIKTSIIFSVEIDSCQTISSSGIYTLNKSVNSSGTCFDINAANVHLDCQGFTLTGDGTGIGFDSSLNNYNNISNCIIQNFSVGVLYYYSDFGFMSNISSKNNTFRGFEIGRDTSSTTLRDSFSSGNGLYGLHFTHTSGVSGNMIYRNNFSNDYVYSYWPVGSIYINNTYDMDIGGVNKNITLIAEDLHTMTSNFNAVIYYRDKDSTELDCQGNSIIGSGINFALDLFYSDYNNISNCIISNYSVGIHLHYADYNIISNVTSINNTILGFEIDRDSMGNTIKDSFSADNGNYGLRLTHSSAVSSNNIIRNNFSNDYVDLTIFSGAGWTMINNTYNMDIGGVNKDITLIGEYQHIMTSNYYGHLSVREEDNIELDCQGYSIIGDGTGSGFDPYFTDSHDVKNCVITNFSIGINLHYSDYSNYTNLSLINNTLRGYEIDRDAYGNTIQDSYFNGNGYGLEQTYSFTGSGGDKIYRNNFTNDYALVMYDYTMYIENNTYDMDIGGINKNISLIAEEKHYMTSNIINQTVFMGWVQNMSLDCQGYSVIGNGEAYGIFLKAASYNIVKNCNIVNHSSRNIYVLNSNYNEILNSTFSGAPVSIMLYNADNNYIYGNTFENTSTIAEAGSTSTDYFSKNLSGIGMIGNYWKNETCLANITRGIYTVCTNPSSINIPLNGWIDYAPLGEGILLNPGGGGGQGGNSSSLTISQIFPNFGLFSYFLFVIILFFGFFSIKI